MTQGHNPFASPVKATAETQVEDAVLVSETSATVVEAQQVEQSTQTSAAETVVQQTAAVEQSTVETAQAPVEAAVQQPAVEQTQQSAPVVEQAQQPDPAVQQQQQQAAASQATQQPAAASTAQQAPPAQQAKPVTQIATSPQRMVPMTEVSLDADVKFNKLDKFGQMKKDETARILFLLPTETGAPRLRMSTIFYDPVTKRSYLAPENPLYFQKFAEMFGEPKVRFGTVIGVYHTDQQGNPLSADVKLQAYVFGQDKFPDLKQLHKTWNLMNRDVLMTCKEENFQKVTFQPTPDRLIAAAPQAEAELRERAEVLFGKPLEPLLGRKLTEPEIVQIINGGGGAPMAGGGGAPQGGGSGYNPFGAPQANGGPATTEGAAATFSDLVANGTNGTGQQ